MSIFSTYRVAGRTAATAATADHCVCQLWNPHGTISVVVYELFICAATAPGAGSCIAVKRTSTTGTAGSTVTPDADNHTAGGRVAPVSGALLYLAAFSVQPTLLTPELDRWVLPAAAAAGIRIPFPEGIEVPAGKGLAVVNGAAIAVPASDVGFRWDD